MVRFVLKDWEKLLAESFTADLKKPNLPEFFWSLSVADEDIDLIPNIAQRPLVIFSNALKKKIDAKLVVLKKTMADEEGKTPVERLNFANRWINAGGNGPSITVSGVKHKPTQLVVSQLLLRGELSITDSDKQLISEVKKTISLLEISGCETFTGDGASSKVRASNSNYIEPKESPKSEYYDDYENELLSCKFKDCSYSVRDKLVLDDHKRAVHGRHGSSPDQSRNSVTARKRVNKRNSGSQDDYDYQPNRSSPSKVARYSNGSVNGQSSSSGSKVSASVHRSRNMASVLPTSTTSIGLFTCQIGSCEFPFTSIETCTEHYVECHKLKLFKNSGQTK